jgi:hypothetical protein
MLLALSWIVVVSFVVWVGLGSIGLLGWGDFMLTFVRASIAAALLALCVIYIIGHSS